MLQIRTCHDTELEVSFQMKDWVAIESQLLQLICILETRYILKLLDPIVRQENPLQSWTVLEAVDGLY